MSKPTTDARGRRYTPVQKKDVLDFINQVNRAKGKGGQAAAHRKYGIAQVTLKLWMESGTGLDVVTRASSDSTLQTLGRLEYLAKKIEAIEARLARMRKEHEQLKSGTR